MKILVANRGEIAVRIIRAASELSIPTVAVYSKDDAESLHIRLADESLPLTGTGPSAYLNQEEIVALAKTCGATAVHPGYGFLSENTDFARLCQAEGLIFIGPTPEHLDLLGDKARAREIAWMCGIPLTPGTLGAATLDEVREFFETDGRGKIMIKAISGGGGRGMRAVFEADKLEEAYTLCAAEAFASFGNGDVYAERLIPRAKHVEIQIIGDGTGAVTHLYERECTIQRRNQKIIEVAPGPDLSPIIRNNLIRAAVHLAGEIRYSGIGSFEFLVDMNEKDEENAFFFLEVNPRVQVEHTVTEEVTGVDLVKTQIALASGRTLEQLGLLQADIQTPQGYAVELRINMETVGKDGSIRPSFGTITEFVPPMGPGIRVDTFAYPGYTVNPNFDSLLAKLVVHSRTDRYADALTKAYLALCEFRIEGVDTNIPVLLNLLKHQDVINNTVSTVFIKENLTELLDRESVSHPLRFMKVTRHWEKAGPISVSETRETVYAVPENTVPLSAVLQGTVVAVDVSEGDTVHENQQVAVMEAMKMQHSVKAVTSGIIRLVCVKEGDILMEGDPLMFIEAVDIDPAHGPSKKTVDPDHIRDDLAEVLRRHHVLTDEARPEAVERRRKTGQRTARENIGDLVDPDSFIEYGGLALAAQRRRHSVEELIKKSPADGLITGIGSVNGGVFGATESRCVVMSYDYTVMAGTQGVFNHQKTDRMLHLAEEWRLPVILFAEGGGGRPSDMDALNLKVAGLNLTTFEKYAKLSGLVPLIGIVSGFCFAGNAALLGCSDVIIATQNANIGMGGPAMIEGGGLGTCRPEDIGPVSVQTPNGVVDILVADEEEAVNTAKHYLSYFQGVLPEYACEDQRHLRHLIPENRLRTYDIRAVIKALADQDSVLELRKDFGKGIVTCFVRVEGVPFGLMANNSLHLGGAIDSDAADKYSRFITLCDAYDIPMIILADTPGFMVGPEAEKTAQVRHFGRMYVTAAVADIPVFAVVLRKGYGLGSMAMIGGGMGRPFFTVAWPTGEFGAMGLEGAVKLGFKKELDAITDPEQKKATLDVMINAAYEHGKGTNMAAFLEIDDVIDPADTRRWIMRGYKSLPQTLRRNKKKRNCIHSW